MPHGIHRFELVQFEKSQSKELAIKIFPFEIISLIALESISFLLPRLEPKDK